MKRLFGVAANARAGSSSSQQQQQQQQHREWIGRELAVGRHHVVVEEVVAEGGFALVFLVKSRSGSGGSSGGSVSSSTCRRLALKRMCVNNETDLNVCRREMSVLKRMRGRANVVEFVDSAVKVG